MLHICRYLVLIVQYVARNLLLVVITASDLPLHLTPPLWGSLSEYWQNVWFGKTGIALLCDDEKNFKMRSSVSTEYTNMTDRQTYLRTDGHRTTA